MEDTRGWDLCEGRTVDEEPMFVRIKDYEDEFPNSEYPHRLNIYWDTDGSGEGNLPSPEEMDVMRIFEDRICQEIEPDSQSSLSLVVTAPGVREWVFYTKDVQEFLRRLSSMPQQANGYPIEIHHEDDPDWDYFSSYVPKDA